jgi:hypothetical protein
MLQTRIVGGWGHASVNGMEVDVRMDRASHIHEWNRDMKRVPHAGETIEVRVREQAIAVGLAVR